MIVPGGVDSGRLRTLVLTELKKAGVKHRGKKIICKNTKEIKTVFGAPLHGVALRAVNCCGSNLNIPAVVVELCQEIRQNADIEGLFRKAGSATRQKEIKLLDCGSSVSAITAHPVDLASLLKLYLRALPEALIGGEVQELLLRCRLAPDVDRASEEHLQRLMNTLMLLPVLNLHLLHYVMELLHAVASHHKTNLMDATNLAIVLAPSVMPLHTTSSAQLQHHVALVKIFIENAKRIGYLSEDLMNQLEMDDVSSDHSRRKKRRSGSLNRVLNGLRKMVGGVERNPPTPSIELDPTRTPIIKSAAKRKLESYEGLSVKTKKEIKKTLAQNKILFTPMKFKADNKTPRQSTTGSGRGEELTCESSTCSEDMLTSSDNLFTTQDTIDLSEAQEKDYVKIPKQEFEEIKSRVSAIESRLSKEWTDIPVSKEWIDTPVSKEWKDMQVQPLQKVQNVYERTLEDVAALNFSSSDQLARRLSKELNIRPSHHTKIIRSPSARKIGSMRRRSKENVTKLVRHKSWNVSTQEGTSSESERFYPYVGLKRGRPNALVSGLPDPRHGTKPLKIKTRDDLDNARSIIRRQSNREVSIKQPLKEKQSNHTEECRKSPSKQKWKNAATYFMERTGESDMALSGRPSVNKLRSQNAGAVLAKAKLFESSSDQSSENLNARIGDGFARRPRTSGAQTVNKTGPPMLKVRPNSARIVEEMSTPDVFSDMEWESSMETKKLNKFPSTPALSPTSPGTRKPKRARSPRLFRSPCVDSRRAGPLRVTRTSPLRRSPRFKSQHL